MFGRSYPGKGEKETRNHPGGVAYPSLPNNSLSRETDVVEQAGDVVPLRIQEGDEGQFHDSFSQQRHCSLLSFLRQPRHILAAIRSVVRSGSLCMPVRNSILSRASAERRSTGVSASRCCYGRVDVNHVSFRTLSGSVSTMVSSSSLDRPGRRHRIDGIHLSARNGIRLARHGCTQEVVVPSGRAPETSITLGSLI